MVKYSEEEKRQAIVLYLEGCGFRKIARIMEKLFKKDYIYQTIMNWVKVAGLRALSEKTKQEKIEVLEMDELNTYIQKKKLTNN